MKKFLLSAMLISSSGMVTIGTNPATSAATPASEAKTAFDTAFQAYLTAITNLQKAYDDQLVKLNNDVGWGINTGPQIQLAEKILILGNGKNDLKPDIQALQATAQSITKKFNTVKNYIKIVQNQTPEPSPNYPERCGDRALQPEYQVQGEGEILKGTGTAIGWAFRPKNCQTQSCYIPLIQNVGMIGTGHQALPTTMRGAENVTGWVTNMPINGKSMPAVVCIGLTK